MAEAFGFGGSSAGTAAVRMVLDTGGFQSKLNAAHSQTVAKTSAMGKEFTKLKGLATQALGALGAVELIRRSIVAYDEQTKAVARLNIAFGNSPALAGASTAAFVEQASALARLTGVQDEQIISAQAALSVFGLTADQLQRITPLVVDYAAFTGTDVTSAAQSMGRAVLGNARALKTIGIDFKRTGDSAADFERIMALVGSKVGGTAEAMATPMDKMRVAADEAFEAIGQGLAPALMALSGALGVIPAPALAAAAAFGVLKLAIGATAGAAGAAFVAGTAIGTWLRDLVPDANLTREMERYGDLWANLAGDMENLVPPADAAYDRIQQLREAVRDGSMSMEQAIVHVEDLNEEFDTGFNPEGVLSVDAALAELASSAGRAVEDLSHFAGMTDEEFAAWSESAASSINFVTAALGRVAGRADSTAAGLIKAMRQAMRAQAGYQKNSETVFTAVRQQFGTAADGFIEYVAGLGTGGARLVGILSRMAGTNRAKFNSIVADFLRAQGMAQSAINAILGISSALVSIPKENTIYINTVYSSSGVPSSVKLGSVGAGAVFGDGMTYGAAGFITNGPTMFRPGFVAGEANYSTPFGKGAEAVIPLTDATLDRLAAAITRRGGGGGTVKVYGPGDPDLIADAVVRKMARMR